jgi:uncharacterized protein (TIGR02452 family)
MSVRIDRGRAAALGQEAVTIAAAGSYVTATGRQVSLGDTVGDAIAATRTYPPDQRVTVPPPRFAETAIAVTGESTLAAGRRLIAAGRDAAALNFASAKNPGGGFLGGARAQEESLCRSSALFPCLDGSPMYAHHRARPDPMYGDWVIHSPGVPVFRDDDGALLDEPYLLTFLTSPAVNAGVVLERDPSRGAEIRAAMQGRIARVLAIAAAEEHDALVLGAWGCGVFGNDPAVIAALFAEALAGPFAGHFAEVVFAILGGRRGEREAFERVFG